ncbi:SSBP4 protein, partial [Amia calva]|nr:SSBP4 protein [Amia calva]
MGQTGLPTVPPALPRHCHPQPPLLLIRTTLPTYQGFEFSPFCGCQVCVERDARCGGLRLALYVYEYLLHVGAQKSAQTFLSEIRWEKNITLGEPPGFLHSWWW